MPRSLLWTCVENIAIDIGKFLLPLPMSGRDLFLDQRFSSPQAASRKGWLDHGKLCGYDSPLDLVRRTQ